MRNRRKRVTAMFGVFGVLVITTSMCANTNIAKANEVDSVFEQQNGIESQFSATPETFIDSMLSVSGSAIGVEKDESEAETFSEGEGSTNAPVLEIAASDVATAVLPVATPVPAVSQQASLTTILPTLTPKSSSPKISKNLKTTKKTTKKKVKKAKKVKKMYANGFICVRSKKSKSSKEVTHLLPEKKVKVTKISGKWAKIKVKKSGKWTKGYVMKKYLSSSKKKADKKANKLAEKFRITGYCPCRQCSEGYGHSTKSGRRAKENHTIATDWSVLPEDTEVYVEGMGTYTVDDVGGGVKGKHIDVFVENHEDTNVVTYRSKKIYELQG